MGRPLDQGADIKTRGGKYKGLIIDYALMHEAILELLLDCGAEMNATPSFKSSPLTEVVKLNYVDAMKLLLDRGAKIEATGGPFATPLQVASREGHIEIARLLLGAGANINNLNGYTGRTPLMWAALNGHVAVIQLLFDRGSNNKRLELARRSISRRVEDVLKR